jgi:hypothetical protein
VGPGFAAMARFWALTLVYATAYVGVATLCSCLFRTPIFSFLTASPTFVTWVLALLAHLDRFKWVVYALPSHYEDGFFKADRWRCWGRWGRCAASRRPSWRVLPGAAHEGRLMASENPAPARRPAPPASPSSPPSSSWASPSASAHSWPSTTSACAWSAARSTA